MDDQNTPTSENTVLTEYITVNNKDNLFIEI